MKLTIPLFELADLESFFSKGKRDPDRPMHTPIKELYGHFDSRFSLKLAVLNSCPPSIVLTLIKDDMHIYQEEIYNLSGEHSLTFEGRRFTFEVGP